MHKSYRVRLFQWALLAACLTTVPSARGNYAAYQAYVSHEHAQTTTLPPLHEFIPKHVPTFTDEGAIRFWQTHDKSPVFRDAGFEMKLCEAVTARRDLDPANFDHYHPKLGRLLGNPSFFNYALHLYNTNQARFTLYHHHLIPLIRGCALMMNMKTPPATGPLVIKGPDTSTVTPVPQQLSFGPAVITPAPPSIVLMMLGIGYVARRVRRVRPQPSL